MTRPRLTLAIVAAALLLAPTSCAREAEGGAPASTGPTVPVDETIDVVMDDFDFEPATITVRAGTTVRFRFRNEGAFVHDAAVGDEAYQKAVAEGKAKRNGPVVGPKKSADYVETFSRSAQLIIGCHQPGHYQQGMRAPLTVS